MGVGGQRQTLAALPPGKTRYPLYRMLGGSQSRTGKVRKISPPPGFDPRTVQTVSSRYTSVIEIRITLTALTCSVNIYIYIYIGVSISSQDTKYCV